MGQFDVEAVLRRRVVDTPKLNEYTRNWSKCSVARVGRKWDNLSTEGSERRRLWALPGFPEADMKPQAIIRVFGVMIFFVLSAAAQTSSKAPQLPLTRVQVVALLD